MALPMTDADVLTLTVDEILASPAIQQRVSMDREKVAEYAELYGEGRDLGHLVVFQTDEGWLLADGFHRLEAARTIGLPTLPCAVFQGSKREAILFATSCNLHGKALSNQDKRKRVTTLLTDPEWAQWSDNAIAKHCGVTHPFVGLVRKSLETVISEKTMSPSLVTVTSDNGIDGSLISELSEHGPVPTRRTYTNRYGQVSTMHTGAIGQQAPAPPPDVLALEAEAPEGDAAPVDIHRNRWGSVTEPPPATPSPVARRESSGDGEWYTPAEVVALVREVLGQIDIDPASCAFAQETVQAATYYTAETDGLRHPWPGTVFCNPPYHMPELARFCGKLLEELDAGQTTAAILLTNSVTDTEWFHRIAPRANAICFTDGRLQFVHATRDGLRPCQGQAVFYFGPHPERFCAAFGALGLLMQVVRAPAAEAQLVLAATPPAPVPQPEPAPAADPVALPLAVWRVVQELQPCTNAAVAKALDKRRTATHKVLQTLVKQGKVARKGQTYRVVDATHA